MRKYWSVFRIALADRMVYRGDFFLSTFLHFIPIVTTILLWDAIFKGSGQETLGDMHYNEMVSYYLLVMITRVFGSMPRLASGIGEDVREGGLRKYLLQPVDFVGYLLAWRVAHKMIFMAMAIGPYTIVFWVCRDYLPGWPGLTTFVLYATSLCLAFLLGFSINCLIGLFSFWFLEVASFLHLFMTVQYFLSGHMFPLSLLPDGVREVVFWLPFAYETYYPTTIFLKQLPVTEAVRIIAVQAIWVVLIWTAIRLAWSRGVRRYAAYGG